ncbi:hypothetical protein PspLS_05417 [Pyricularia sp. CBS 133598]|nr:hypothetical protein PspLS_05417 [Pyricularia sp. CBS 133598]
MSSHASLSAAADERKARLAKLKSLKRKQPGPDENNFESEPTTSISTSAEHRQSSSTTTARRSASPPEKDVARLHLSGRNYDPETRGPKLGFENAPTESMDQPTLEEQAAEVEAEIRQQAKEDEANDKGIDLFKLQPKKPNWDLKRELDKKMEVLNVRTDNAIARLVRERLSAKKAPAVDAAVGSASGDGPGEIDGAALVEGLRLREQEEEVERRREREADLI